MSKPTADQTILVLGTAFTFICGVAACSHQVKPDGMSAEAHEQQANTDTAKAQSEVARASREGAPLPNAAVNPEGSSYPVGAPDPATQDLTHARQLEEHAKQHRAAAAKLETFVQDECRGFPPETRASCPMLGPVKQVEDIQNGVRVWFASTDRVEAVAAHMRCHFAYAQAYGFDTVESCPLYVKGLEIKVARGGKAIELTSREPRMADAIRARTREEAILVRK